MNGVGDVIAIIALSPVIIALGSILLVMFLGILSFALITIKELWVNFKMMWRSIG